MTHELFTALAVFALVSSITPGPNNLMLMASGANFGLRRSVPHMLGMALGFVAMVFLVGIGLQQMFTTWPPAHTALKAVCVAYLLYLAWKIANAAPPERTASAGNPFTVLQAAAFRWVNPKAWARALTATSVYAPTQTFGAIALVALVLARSICRRFRHGC